MLSSVVFIDAFVIVTGSIPFSSSTPKPLGFVKELSGFFTVPLGYSLPSIVTASAGYNLPPISVILLVPKALTVLAS